MDNHATPAPSMLSTEFHLRFFPALLYSRFGKHVEASRTSFVSARFMQCVLLLYGAIAAAFAGVSLLPGFAGWLLLVLAAACVSYVVVVSTLEARGLEPTYEGFLFPFFFACLALGFATGALIGLGEPTVVRLVYGCAGLVLGYCTGLLAGLHGQRIGFFAVLMYPFAIAAAGGVLITAMVLLST